MKQLSTILLLILLTITSVNGQQHVEESKSPQSSLSLDDRVDQIMAKLDRGDAPGAAVAILQNGKVVFAKGYGIANLEYNVPVSPETVFYIGSIGKQFTAFAIVRLAEQKKLSLDDNIRVHLPEMHDFGSPITIRNLLHHTSGLRDYFGLLTLSGTRRGDLITQKNMLDAIFAQRELNFSPGNEYLYSNSNYVLLATIVERATGEPFRVWMKENVFTPLGMDNTLIGDNHRQIILNRAAPYTLGDEGKFLTEVAPYSGYGPGGVYSTVNDLAKWVHNFEEPSLGTAKTRESMYRQGKLNNGDTLAYACGLKIEQHRGLRRIGHGGAYAGYRSYLTFFPDQRFAVIVLSNFDESNPNNLARQIAEACLEDQLDDLAREAKPGGTNKQVVEIDPASLDDYVGRYQFQPEILLTFTREGDRFFGQVTGQDRKELFPSSESTFFFKDGDATLTFHRDEDRSVSRVTFRKSGRETSIRRAGVLPGDDVSRYVGEYFSPELNTTLSVVAEGDKLFANHIRHGKVALIPVDKDKFRGNSSFRDVVFQRGDSSEITGFRITTGRIRNLLFELQK